MSNQEPKSHRKSINTIMGIMAVGIVVSLVGITASPRAENAESWNTPFFGQDPANLGQQYLLQRAADQKKIDGLNSKTKSKEKAQSSTGTSPATMPDYSVPTYNPPSDNLSSPSGNVNSPSSGYEPSQSTQPPSGDLYRGY